MNYELWPAQSQSDLESLLLASSDKDKTIYQSRLYNVLMTMIDVVNNRKGLHLDEDDKIIILNDVYTKIIVRITIDRLKTAQSYIYNSIVNLSINRCIHNDIRVNKIHKKLTKPLSSYNDFDMSVDYVVQKIAADPSDFLDEDNDYITD